MSSLSKEIFDFLVTRDLDPEILDRQGKPVLSPDDAELFSFDWKGPTGRNYGTAVILLNPESGVELYSADNVGRTMEPRDKDAWFGTERDPGFFGTLKNLAIRGDITGGFNARNINRLKYTMQGMAAIKEGLFEGYHARGQRTSYSDQPQHTKIMIRHSRDIAEGEARYRAIESIYVETADGERFRVPSRSLSHGRMLARHVAEGGNPYDAFGQHINEIMTEISGLGRFIRATRNRELSEQAQAMLESAVRHYGELKAKARRMISRRGYHEARDSFDPARIEASEELVQDIQEMFRDSSLDQRVAEAAPILARLEETGMKEITEFAQWAQRVTEGTWALPDTDAQQRELKKLMSEPLPVGTDAVNATEQLYDLIGDDELFDILAELADRDSDANIWDDPQVQARLQELGVDMESGNDAAAVQPTEPPAQAGMAEDLDTDGVMMTRASNMSSESREFDLDRLVELARR
jgi:hypothetical protein